MRKKYLSALLFGALLVTSAGTFTSCKDYDDEINNLQEQIDVIKADLATLTETVKNLDGVKDMSFTDGKLVIETGNGKKVEVDIPSATGVAEIKLEGNVLYVNGEEAGKVEIPEGETVKVEVKEDGKLYINDEVQDLEIGSKVVMVDNGDYYTMTIDGKESYNLPKYNAANELNYISLGEDGINFGDVAAGTAVNWGVTDDKVEWNGKEIAAGTLLIGQMSSEEISVSPASFDLSAQKLKLVDTEGNEAPVNVIATPVVPVEDGKPATGSRASSANGKWNLSIEMTDKVTKDNVENVFGEEGAYVLYALSVNDVVSTVYDITIKVGEKSAETSGITLYNTEISVNGDNTFYATESGGTFPANTNKFYSITKANVIELVKKNRLADSYITFEGADKVNAAKYNVTADGMKIIGSADAAGKELTATIHLLSVEGLTSTETIQVKFEGSEISTPSETPATEYKVSKDKFVWVNVKGMFGLNDLAFMSSNVSVAFAEGEAPLFDTHSTITFYKEDKTTQISNFTTVLPSEIAWMKVTFDNFSNEAKVGETTLVTTLTNNETTASEVRKFTTKVNVVLPEWDEVFVKKTAAWDDNVAQHRTNAGGKMAVNPGTFYTTTTDYAETITLSDAELSLVEMGDKTTCASNTITLGEDVLKDGKILKDITAKFEYKFAEKLVISENLTIHPYSVVDGFSLEFYDQDKKKDVIEVTYDNSILSNSTGKEIAAHYHKGTDGDGANKNKYFGIAALVGDAKYALDDEQLGNEGNISGEIVTPGYTNVKVTISDTGAISIKNNAAEGDIITEPNVGSSYDITLRVTIMDGAIKNTADYTVRIKK